MKSTTLLGVAAVAAVLGAPVAQAQEQGRVLSSTPILQQVSVPRQVCGNEMVYNNDNTSGAGAVIGAIAGGILGNQVGGGTGRAAAAHLYGSVLDLLHRGRGFRCNDGAGVLLSA